VQVGSVGGAELDDAGELVTDDGEVSLPGTGSPWRGSGGRRRHDGHGGTGVSSWMGSAGARREQRVVGPCGWCEETVHRGPEGPQPHEVGMTRLCRA